MYWLGKDFELVSLGTRTLEQIGGGSLAGEKEDLTAGEKSANIDGCFDAVHIRHDDVADDEVRMDIPGALHRSSTGINGGRIEPVLVENDCKGIGDNPLVVNHKNFRLRLAIGHQVKPTIWMQLWPATMLLFDVSTTIITFAFGGLILRVRPT
jgi:hypothetical protein